MDKTADDKKGFHRFKDHETGEPYGYFEVFWHTHGTNHEFADEDGNELPDGWYFWACMPGCYLPDSEPIGPFETSLEAYDDAVSY